MGPQKRGLTTLAMLMLAITASGVAGAQETPRGSTASGPVVVKRIDVVHRAGGVEIEITGSGPLRATTSRLSNPERFVIDVQDSILDRALAASHSIPVDTPEIKRVRFSRFYQPGESITRVVVDLASKREVEVTSAPDKLRLKLRPEPAQVATAEPGKPEKTESRGATPAALGRIREPRYSIPKADVAHVTAAPVRPAETPADEGKLARDKAAAVSAERSESSGQPEPVKVEGMVSRPPALLAVAITPPPLDSTAPPVNTIAKVEPDKAAAARNEDTDMVEAFPLKPDPPLGAGVTGKKKDATLGSDDEAAIRATIPGDKRFPRRGESSVPVAVQLSGAATAGYYQASTSNGNVSHEASPVGSMRLDASGYVHSPGFLNFSVKPQASAGRQTSEGVFPDGEGVSATTTFLGGGVMPLTVSYHRLNRKVVTFGPLDRLAGLEANTFQDSLGANWKLRLPHLPELGLNYSSYSDSYEPLAALAPKTSNQGRLLSADISETALGWNLQSRYKVERSSQDLINLIDPTQAPYRYQRNDQEIRASADREFGKWMSTSFVAGKTRSENEVQGRPFDQSFRFLTGNSFFRPSKKLTLGFHAGVTDNVIGANLERAVGGDSFTPAPAFVLVPTQARLRMINYSGSAQYAFTSDLRAQAEVVRETTHAPQDSSIASSTSELTSLQTGIAFVHRFRWWQFQSYYAVNGGRFTYAATGSSRSSGQRANVGITVGSLQSLELTAGVHGSQQNVTGNTYMYDRSAGANVTLSRSLWDRWRLRATYDRERDQYKFSGAEFSSVGNGISIAVVHPRVEFSASHNIRDGLTFQADPRLQFVSPGQSGLLLGAFPGTLVIPTGATWSSAALVFHPAPKFTGRVGWLNSRQRLQNAVSNYYTEWEISAGYQFRSITLDFGYLAHDQNFAVDLFKRNRFFFRVVREFTFF
jgi:hypothetical protein